MLVCCLTLRISLDCLCALDAYICAEITVMRSLYALHHSTYISFFACAQYLYAETCSARKAAATHHPLIQAFTTAAEYDVEHTVFTSQCASFGSANLEYQLYCADTTIMHGFIILQCAAARQLRHVCDNLTLNTCPCAKPHTCWNISDYMHCHLTSRPTPPVG